MHQCLCIPEIQATILDNLALSDCARVACTSSSFFEQAMNATWAELDSLIPLVRCIPPDAVEERVTTLPFGPPHSQAVRLDIAFKRELQQTDWDAF
ncbi:hypothetical protein BC629DRAFT_536801 [Irpex lacteus]|nr:hypothetical protein BC629DRAFT_536801 [Irpex lacteus]